MSDVQAGEVLQSSSLTDAERELHITSCGELMQAAYARYEAHGDFADKGEAHRWRLQMEEAIRARSAGQVARMETERGIA